MNAPLVPLSRRALLQGAGALVVSFSLDPAHAQQAAPTPAAAPPKLPGSLNGAPFLDSWIRLDGNGAVTVFSGKAELGQGIRLSLIHI